MKLTTEQAAKLRELAFAGVSNKDIAVQLGIPITEVYAYRSLHGITREKVAKANGNAPCANVVAQQPMKPFVNPEFEAAIKEAEAPPAIHCKDCAHWSCYAKGSANTMLLCSGFITAEARRKDYLYDRKQEFLRYLQKGELSLDKERYSRIEFLLDELIPDSWRCPRG